jgi:hypothetical protein
MSDCLVCGRQLLPAELAMTASGRQFGHVCPTLWLVAVDGLTCDGFESIQEDRCEELYGDDPRDMLVEYVEANYAENDYSMSWTFWIRQKGLPHAPWRRYDVEGSETVVFAASEAKPAI